jgi:hypothetical protein
MMSRSSFVWCGWHCCNSIAIGSLTNKACLIPFVLLIQHHSAIFIGKDRTYKLVVEGRHTRKVIILQKQINLRLIPLIIKNNFLWLPYIIGRSNAIQVADTWVLKNLDFNLWLIHMKKYLMEEITLLNN